MNDIDSSTDEQAKNRPDEFNGLLCSWLEYELSETKKKGRAHTLDDEKLSLQKQKRFFGVFVACIAIIVPLIILGVLSYQLLVSDSAFYKMGIIPQTIFISASFLSFIVIYTVLIKGMFEQKKEEENQSPIKKAVDILREYRSHDSP